MIMADYGAVALLDRDYVHSTPIHAEGPFAPPSRREGVRHVSQENLNTRRSLAWKRGSLAIILVP